MNVSKSYDNIKKNATIKKKKETSNNFNNKKLKRN